MELVKNNKRLYVTILNNKTCKAEKLIYNYLYAHRKYIQGLRKYKDVLNFYNNPSYNKVRAEMKIEENIKAFEGYNYNIIGGNSCYFSCGWMVEIDGTKWLIYETYQNRYAINITDREL